jgi:hypothetical protein
MAKNVSEPTKDELPHPRYPRSSAELANRSYVPESQANEASMFNVTPTRGEKFRGSEGSANEHTSPPVSD